MIHEPVLADDFSTLLYSITSRPFICVDLLTKGEAVIPSVKTVGPKSKTYMIPGSILQLKKRNCLMIWLIITNTISTDDEEYILIDGT